MALKYIFELKWTAQW